jgi:hypothetical protein
VVKKVELNDMLPYSIAADDLLDLSSSGLSLADRKCTGLRRLFLLHTRHGRNLIKGQLMSFQIPRYHPTKHTEKTTTAFTHSRQCCATNPSSLSLPLLPFPGASPPLRPRALQG